MDKFKLFLNSINAILYDFLKIKNFHLKVVYIRKDE